MVRPVQTEESQLVERALARLRAGETLRASWMAEHGLEWPIDTSYTLVKEGDVYIYTKQVNELGEGMTIVNQSEQIEKMNELTLFEKIMTEPGIRQIMGLSRFG